LAAKGFLIGQSLRSRGRREAEDLADVFLEASHKDMYDCAKLLICDLHSKPVEELEVLLYLFYIDANGHMQC
jgi:hypothetical protein